MCKPESVVKEDRVFFLHGVIIYKPNYPVFQDIVLDQTRTILLKSKIGKQVL